MSHKHLFVTLPALSLMLSGFASPFAQEASGGGLGWLGVLIVLILLIPLVWWLKQSRGPQTAEHYDHVPPTLGEAFDGVSEEEATAAKETSAAPPVVAEPATAVTPEPALPLTAAASEPDLPVTTEAPEPTSFHAAAAQESAPTRLAEASAKPDDLTIIEGIGPKISRVLQENGFKTFADLAAADLNQVEGVLQAAGLSNITNPVTWAEQAQLAADGQWDELKTLQNQLKGGRRA